MQELYNFIVENWILSTLFLTVLGILIFSFVSQKSSISPTEAVNLLNNLGDKLLIIDLRPIDAFKNGQIINAVNLAVNNLENGLDNYSKFKQTPVLIYCDSGMVSSSNSSIFRKKGFSDFRILRGGLDSWKQENLPTEQNK